MGLSIFKNDLFKNSDKPFKYAIAIPACNEEKYIRRCLKACSLSMKFYNKGGTIVVLINNSSDNTFNFAQDWANCANVPVMIVDVKFPAALAHAGKARQTALGIASKCVSRQGFLLTTDADSHPYPDWVQKCLSPLETGKADMVCGKIFLDPEAAERLPDLILKRGDIEEEYRFISREIHHLLNPDPVNIWPFHGQASGASLAVSLGAYRMVGGIPAVPVGEDRALAKLFEEHDLKILYSDEAKVWTSSRLGGRARGGMADTIAARVAGRKHICDESVERAELVLTRALWRAKFRLAHASSHKLMSAYVGAGIEFSENIPAFDKFGALWSFVESKSPLLTRRRLSWEEMFQELPKLKKIREEVRAMVRTPSIQTHASRVR